MIRIELIGGLGNWLFQYAAARSLALRHGTSVALNVQANRLHRDSSGRSDVRMLRHFPLQARFTRIGPRGQRLRDWLVPGERSPLFEERGWGFDSAFLQLGPSARLLGYFQSSRYWSGYEDQIRSELTPRVEDERPVAPLLDAIARSNAVSVHVRRGDYLRSPLHNVCTPEYYARAMRLMRDSVRNPAFFVFSDDPDWCRAHLRGEDVTHIALADLPHRPVVDLLLMSRCSHHIVANSTFSWWGAWLNDRAGKIVLAPDRWFNDPAMNESALLDTLPADWTRLPPD